METTTIKPFSKAYFDLVAALPELREVFALGPRVIVVGRTRAIVLAEHGLTETSPNVLASIARDW
jgi:hypothetical protein